MQRNLLRSQEMEQDARRLWNAKLEHDNFQWALHNKTYHTWTLFLLDFKRKGDPWHIQMYRSRSELLCSFSGSHGSCLRVFVVPFVAARSQKSAAVAMPLLKCCCRETKISVPNVVYNYHPTIASIEVENNGCYPFSFFSYYQRQRQCLEKMKKIPEIGKACNRGAHWNGSSISIAFS